MFIDLSTWAKAGTNSSCWYCWHYSSNSAACTRKHCAYISSTVSGTVANRHPYTAPSTSPQHLYCFSVNFYSSKAVVIELVAVFFFEFEDSDTFGISAPLIVAALNFKNGRTFSLLILGVASVPKMSSSLSSWKPSSSSVLTVPELIWALFWIWARD